MPLVPLLKNFVNRRAVRPGELPAEEYNRNAERTDEAYDMAEAAGNYATEVYDLVVSALTSVFATLGAKVDKAAGSARVYIRDGAGDETTGPYASEATPGSFPVRDGAGQFKVGTPTDPAHVTPKSITDSKQDKTAKLSGFLSIIDSMTGTVQRIPSYVATTEAWVSIATTAIGRTIMGAADAAAVLSAIGAAPRLTGNNVIYRTNGSGATVAEALTSSPTAWAVVQRDGNSQFEVGAPTAANHPWRKTDADTFGKAITKVAYTGGASTVEYYEIARLPIDGNSNAASLTIQGRLGGWNNLQLATYAITLANRSVAYTGVDITASVIAQGNLGAPGNANSALGSADIEVWGQADKSAIVYVKATAYYGFDLRASGTGYSGVNGTVNFVTTPATPTGTKIWALSTAPRLEVDTTGQLIASSLRVASGGVPASATATGVAGQVRWDANYLYVCVAPNTWKRTALAAW